MTSATEEALKRVTDDRDRVGATAVELREVVRDNIATAKRTIDPRTYAREYPWIALGLVFGAGVAIAMTGAERKAATEVKEFVVDKVKGDEPDPLVVADGGADHPIEWPKTVGDRVRGAADSLLYRALTPVLEAMRQRT